MINVYDGNATVERCVSMAYQLPIFGFHSVSGGDTLVFDETTLKVYKGNVVTREYTWDNFKCAQFNYLHSFSHKMICVYYLYFDDGKKVVVCADENSEDFQKLLLFKPRNNIRNAKHLTTLVGIVCLAILAICAVFSRLSIS